MISTIVLVQSIAFFLIYIDVCRRLNLAWVTVLYRRPGVAAILLVASRFIMETRKHQLICQFFKNTVLLLRERRLDRGVNIESPLKFNPFTPKSAKFKTEKKILNFILQKCQNQTAPPESTAQ